MLCPHLQTHQNHRTTLHKIMSFIPPDSSNELAGAGMNASFVLTMYGITDSDQGLTYQDRTGTMGTTSGLPGPSAPTSFAHSGLTMSSGPGSVQASTEAQTDYSTGGDNILLKKWLVFLADFGLDSGVARTLKCFRKAQTAR